MKLPLDSSVKSVKRSLDLLEFLAEASQPPSFLEMLRTLAIPRSSLFYLLGELMGRGYIDELPGSRYRLGRMPAVIAGRASSRGGLIEVVRPVIRALSDESNEFSAFYVVDGWTVRCLAIEEGTHALSYRIAPDHTLPFHAFSGGKVALAELEADALETYLRDTDRTVYTANTIVEVEALRREVGRVRREGIGRSRSEFAVGVAGFARAVHQHGKLIGAINVSVPEPRLDPEHEKHVIECLRRAAAKLESQLR